MHVADFTITLQRRMQQLQQMQTGTLFGNGLVWPNTLQQDKKGDDKYGKIRMLFTYRCFGIADFSECSKPMSIACFLIINHTELEHGLCVTISITPFFSYSSRVPGFSKCLNMRLQYACSRETGLRASGTSDSTSGASIGS